MNGGVDADENIKIYFNQLANTVKIPINPFYPVFPRCLDTVLSSWDRLSAWIPVFWPIFYP